MVKILPLSKYKTKPFLKISKQSYAADRNF